MEWEETKRLASTTVSNERGEISWRGRREGTENGNRVAKSKDVMGQTVSLCMIYETNAKFLDACRIETRDHVMRRPFEKELS